MGSNSSFQTFTISELIDEIAMGPFGSNIKVDCFVSEGVPVFNGSNLMGFTTNDDELRYVTNEKAKSLGRALASRGDVVVTHRGTLGQIAYIPGDSLYEHYIISQSQFRMRMNEKVLPAYLVYYFHTPLGQWKIMSNKAQTGVPALGRPTTTFQKIDVELPNIETQLKTVKLLDSFQSVIRLNQQANGYLAEICETLAAAVEADGESVLADISVQITEKEACSISSLESYVSTESLLPNKGGRQEASSLPTTGKVTVYKMGDTLVSNIRPYFKKIWLADRDGTCSGDVIVFRAKEPRHAAYLYSMLRSDSFFEHVMAGAKGTKMPRGDKKQMMQYPVARGCDKGTLDALTAMVGQIGANSRENETLSNLRDALLPKLMSGKVDVSEVELPTLPNNRFKDSVT